VRSVGDDLISVAVADPAAAQALAAGLRASGLWIEAVAGIDSVVVRFDIAVLSQDAAREQLAGLMATDFERAEKSSTLVEIPIVYGGEGGPDLPAVCETLGLTQQEFITLHSGEYTVDMLGFIPGFAYIGGLDARLEIDRLPQPRQFVPAGSVGIAGGRTGLYALPGPGGWPLIGRTSCTLFDAQSDQPFVLDAGTRVRFTAVDTL
jgi:allophanate hydrolase